MRRLQFSVLCLGRSHSLCWIRALWKVRQYGSAAHFQRVRDGSICLAVPPASYSHLPLRSLPEPFFFDPGLSAHCAGQAPGLSKAGHAFSTSCMKLLPRNTGVPKWIDFFWFPVMMSKGDGVRRITAVLLAGQMMTPDKDLVAGSCVRQRSGNIRNIKKAGL